MYFAARSERRRKRDLGRGSKGMTGFARSADDDPAANDRVRHGASRGMSDTWTGLERLVRPWTALRGRKTCETLSMLIGDGGGLRPEGGTNRVGMASRPGPRRCGVPSAPRSGGFRCNEDHSDGPVGKWCWQQSWWCAAEFVPEVGNSQIELLR